MSGPSLGTSAADSLRNQIDHIFLLPDAGKGDDGSCSLPRFQLDLVSNLLDSLKAFIPLAEDASATALITCQRMIENMIAARPNGGSIHAPSVKDILSGMRKDDVLALDIRAQNAGLFITKTTDGFSFEAFELLALNEKVMACKGRLIRPFPLAAISLPMHSDNGNLFLTALTETLEQLDIHTSPDSLPKIQKAGQEHHEDRDTVNPCLVTEMLMGWLRGQGGQKIGIVQIRKSSREQVKYNIGSQLAWHRSALWLFIRVALRLVLDRAPNACEKAISTYKAFMIFHMSHILDKARFMDLSSDELNSMSAKVCSRVHKLSVVADTPWLNRIRPIVEATSLRLQDRWIAIQKKHSTRLNMALLDCQIFEPYTELKLSTLNEHITWIRSRTRVTRTGSHVGSRCHSSDERYSLNRLEPKSLPIEGYFDGKLKEMKLLEFESWVAKHLEQWTTRTAQQPRSTFVEAIRQVETAVSSYHKAATGAYFDNPEAMSLAYLFILELWVACDRLATKAVPLMLDYHPAMHHDAFGQILLPKLEHMVRLKEVEQYIQKRSDNALSTRSPISGDFGQAESFALRYFHESAHLRGILSQARTENDEGRRRKQQEWVKLKREYDDLVRQASSLSHDQIRVPKGNGKYELQCKRKCLKCEKLVLAEKMAIAVWEDILPLNDLDAMGVISELNMDGAVRTWRSLTLKLVTNIFGARRPKKESNQVYWLADDERLGNFGNPSHSRLQLGSDSKPFRLAHYGSQLVSKATTVESVCKSHGSRYSYRGRDASVTLGTLGHSLKILGSGSLAQIVTKMSGDGNRTLDNYTRMTKHTSNDVMAEKHACPRTMSISEWEAFGHIRAGHKLQWQNVLVELLSPSLNLCSVESSLLLIQATCEAGPGTPAHDSLRLTHGIVNDEAFADDFLEGLRASFQRVEESWESTNVFFLLVFLSLRLLSTSGSLRVQRKCLDLLARLRHATFRWSCQLFEKADQSESEEERENLADIALFFALICHATFDVGTAHLQPLLRNADMAPLLIITSVLGQRHQTLGRTSSNPLMRMMMQRQRRLAHEMEPQLATEIVEGRNGCLDSAVGYFWPAFSPGRFWSRVSKKASSRHVLGTECPSGDGVSALPLSYNLLTGILLVNGKTMSTLPDNFLQNEVFQLLFKGYLPQVATSNRRGMQYSASQTHHGWDVHFALIDKIMVVRTVCGDQEFEFIPSSKLGDEFPAEFRRNYYHWLNLKTAAIEFRALDSCWQSSTSNWSLLLRERRMVQGDFKLLSSQSHLAVTIAGFLEPVETAQNISCILSNGVVRISLPRFQLSFSLQVGSTLLASNDFANMCLDEDQSFETLIGLKNRLVLSTKGSSHQPEEKIVLVPRGKLSPEVSDCGVSVSVVLPPLPRLSSTSPSPLTNGSMRYSVFTIDSKLQRLRESGLLQDKLYLAYLHAMTSHCLPDPFTKRTGTEEALEILNTAAVKSYLVIDEDSMELLRRISDLSPKRTYYPSNMKVMEMTKWSNLPILSQYDGFCLSINRIVVQDMTKLKLRTQKTAPNQPHPHPESSRFLVERAVIRNSFTRVSGFGAEGQTSNHDKNYAGRKPKPEWHQRLVTGVSRLILDGDATDGKLLLAVSPSIKESILSLAGNNVRGMLPASHLPPEKLRFSPQTPFGKFIDGMWCRIHQLLSHFTDIDDRHHLSVIFAFFTFTCRNKETWHAIQTLIAFITTPQMRRVQPVEVPFFQLNIDRDIWPQIHRLISENFRPMEYCPEQFLTRKAGEKSDDLDKRRRAAHKENADTAVEQLIRHLEDQWSSRKPELSNTASWWVYIDRTRVEKEIVDVFEMRWRMEKFDQYMDEIVSILLELPLVTDSFRTEPKPEHEQLHMVGSSNRGFVKLDDLLQQDAPALGDLLQRTELPPLEGHVNGFSQTRSSSGHSRMRELLCNLKAHASGPYEVEYISELEKSSNAGPPFATGARTRSDISDIRPILSQYLCKTITRVQEMQKMIQERFGTTNARTSLAKAGGHWPRISSLLLLQQLSRNRWRGLRPDWKRCLVEFALALTECQRAERLVAAKTWIDLKKELDNIGHTNWDPMEYPDSLLLEVENGLLIRPIQEEIASHMRKPYGGLNSVMQLNMGEGKSSVIVMMVAAALADAKQLVRVVVAKPQANQMLHTLISRLGGLINRQIFHLPFSRSLQLAATDVSAIRTMMVTCMREGGVLLVQPEHLLSFKLMGLENICSGNKSLGQALLSTQCWLDSVSRDIVDESDENFSVKFELVYTMGAQRPIDLGHLRWSLIQSILVLAMKVGEKIHGKDPTSIYLERSHPDAMPIVRILKDSSGDEIIKQLLEHIFTNGLEGFPINRQPPAFRDSVRNYITLPEVSHDIVREVEDVNNGFSTSTTQGFLHLLRGLISGGILLFVLKEKRWRVNYGRTWNRIPETPLAVPYRAKDSPTPRSEFSHPDVIIALTCLTYYYGGLTDDELDVAFGRLDRQDQSEYELWVRDAKGLDPTFTQLSSINLKDRTRSKELLYPKIRYSKGAIDYYLSNFVFAKYLREFPKKLAASGWDLARQKSNPLTGFSGTCDSNYMLPLTVGHLDLPDQLHTNASVLDRLLQPENDVREVDLRKRPIPSSTFCDVLISSIVQSKENPIQVILDVGAQILELSNIEIARKWLDEMQDPKFEAVIFVNDEDELSVLNKHGMTESLLSSTYLHQTAKCLVFLDEAHTRGTDLQLPEGYRAAVTLGPKLTKDRLVQACMRMRKLGVGQSVTFFVQPEIQHRIRSLQNMSPQDVLKVLDVLVWSISETWIESHKIISLWASQGIRHQKQEVIWQRCVAKHHNNHFTESIDGETAKYLEDEAQTVEQRYGPRQTVSENGLLEVKEVDDSDLASRQRELLLIRQKCREHNVQALDLSALQEEQERELELCPELELERETQIEQPHWKGSTSHWVSAVVRDFVKTGNIAASPDSKDILPAFAAFQGSSFDGLFEPRNFPCNIFVTGDFAKTVKVDSTHIADSYQRPVRWVVIGGMSAEQSGNPVIVIMSPFEVNELYEELRESKAVTLHLYKPRTNFVLPNFDHLKLCAFSKLPEGWCLPPSLVAQLNLFAGQLWLSSYEQYTALCRFLGLSYEANQGKKRIMVDGFEGKTKSNPDCAFDESPVQFLEAVFTKIRTKSQDISRTHMGRILRGEVLTREDFEGRVTDEQPQENDP